MKKITYSLACLAIAGVAVSCSSVKSMTEVAVSNVPKVVEDNPVRLHVDDEGFINIFDGSSLKGWRGYGKDHVPAGWTIEDGALRLSRGSREGGDIIFAHKFKNFILEMEWKVSKGANSGIFYLAQEAYGTGKDGRQYLEPIYVSAPEYQVLDNENHPDAKLGKNNNRKSASLYDMIPAEPQNQNPYGEWNKTRIVVKNGKVEHWQNDVKVLEYKLWTPEWTALLQDCKFSEKAWPSAFKLLNNCGGDNHEGFIGLQDHGDDVWYRNIRVKEL